MEASPDDLQIEEGRISVRGAPGGPSVTTREIGDAAYRRLDGKVPDGEDPTLEERDVLDPDNVAFSFGTTAVLAEVDRETGRVTSSTTSSSTTAERSTIVDGQIHGGAAQGIGGALFEEIVYSPEGQPLTTTFMDYLVPTASEIPPFETLHMTTTADHIPGGVRGHGRSRHDRRGLGITAAIETALPDIELTLTSSR
jgi:carbon-monoxide dehydrogenase large subunit